MWLCKGGANTTASARDSTAMPKKGKWFSILSKICSCSGKAFKKQTIPSATSTAEPVDAGIKSKSVEEQSLSGGDRGADPRLGYVVVVASSMAGADQVGYVTATQGMVGHAGEPLHGEELAALKIQKVFRGYLARRALRARKRMERLEAVFSGGSAKRQAALTLRYMQALVRVQARVRARRIQMSEDVQHEIWQKRREEHLAKKSDTDGSEHEWDDSIETVEETEARKLSKHEGGVKRERALAYAYARRLWRSAPKQASLYTGFDPSQPYRWGWSWIERWMAARPLESRTSIHLPPPSKQQTKCLAHSQPPPPSPPARPAAWASRRSLLPRSPLGTPLGTPSAAVSLPDASRSALEEEGSVRSGSMLSLAGHRCCVRHSISGSSMKDDDECVRSSVVPNYMNATESTKARALSSNKHRRGALQVQSVSAKRRLSFSLTSNTSL